jgi:hypothetical protein
MKKFIFVLTIILLVQILGYSQTSNWRNPSQNNNSQQNSNPPSTQRSDVSSWRSPQPKQNTQQPIYTPPKQNHIYYDPYVNMGWGWDRWNNVYGAPMFGWDYYSPAYYYNRWGYREPARVYYYSDGRQDTIKAKKIHFSFGLQKPTFKNQMGMWFTLGDRVYFIADYNNTINSDKSDYFANKTIWNYYNDVMIVNGVSKKISELFPLSSDVVRQGNLYLGLGKKFGRFGTHISVGMVNEDIRYRYKDDIGYITFPKNKDSYLIYKFGALYDIKSATIKVDYDPVLKVGYFGAGINF